MEQKRSPAEKRATAYHEAGHAVIGRVLRLACGQASIVGETEDNLGHAEIENPLLTWKRGDGRRKLLAEAFCI
jgi:hypothetical protein